MAETTYKIWQRGPTYAVEVTEPDGARRTVYRFAREAGAKAWIADERWKAAMGASKERPRALKKPG